MSSNFAHHLKMLRFMLLKYFQLFEPLVLLRMEKIDMVIVGAGPTGLGAAIRLQQHKHQDWLLIDAAPEAGGLACTDVTPEGFLFDMGGHVIFSHYDFFDQLLDAAVGVGEEHWAVHERVSYVW